MHALALDLASDNRFLDHLCPLCHILDMPLLVVEEEKLKTIEKYYNDNDVTLAHPQIKTIYIPNAKLSYEQLTKEYDCFFQSTFFQDSFLKYFAELNKKKIMCIYCPHGNSDKGYFSDMLKPMHYQDMTLVYGDQMIDRLKAHSLWPKSNLSVTVGNYRKLYYEKFKTYYDAIIEKEILPFLDKNKKTILYAPTWNDPEQSSSLFGFVKEVLKLKNEFNIIVKLHPFLQEEISENYFATLALLEKEKEKILLLNTFPLIYPLLNICDAYIGDFSSIGYDFLFFKRPMFFFHWEMKQKRFFSLYDCGIKIDLGENILQKVQKGLSAWGEKEVKKQEALYNYTFSPKTEEEVKSAIVKDLQNARKI
jgi:hypothetical protein